MTFNTLGLGYYSPSSASLHHYILSIISQLVGLLARLDNNIFYKDIDT